MTDDIKDLALSAIDASAQVDDLVGRLRADARFVTGYPAPSLLKAADHIEALERENAEISAMYRDAMSQAIKIQMELNDSKAEADLLARAFVAISEYGVFPHMEPRKVIDVFGVNINEALRIAERRVKGER